MPVEIIGFREENGKSVAKKFATVVSVDDVFAHPDKILKKIAKEEWWNLYYSVADCEPGSSRHHGDQHFLPIDIDHVDEQDTDDVIEAVCEAIGVEYGQVYSLRSGWGVQVLVKLQNPILNKAYSNGYFPDNRKYYLKILQNIEALMTKQGLTGKPDPSVFKNTQVMRMPNTENRKNGKPVMHARIINNIAEAVDFDITKWGALEDIPESAPKQHGARDPDDDTLKSWPEPDVNAVLKGCKFLQDCYKDQAGTTEPQWYAMLSVLANMPGGRELCHDYSREHPTYNEAATDRKIEQAKKTAGPRTCKNIAELGGKCKECPNFGAVTGPILLKGPDYIKTKKFGFRTTIFGENGKTKPGRVVTKDLAKDFDQQFGYIALPDSKIVYEFTGTHWKQAYQSELRNFAERMVVPEPTHKERTEFCEQVYCTNLRNYEWFGKTTFKKINFQNGVLDIEKMELLPHSRDFGFLYVLPYPYNPHATCPSFDKHLSDITLDDEELQKILMEYIGYAVSNDPVWEQKALIMPGIGNNGKSTFIRTIRNLVGGNNFSTITLEDLGKDQYLANLEGTLFKISEENDAKLYKSQRFKNITGGGMITVKKLYCQPYQIDVRAKMILACNELPKTSDTTEGFFRRLLIVPFDAKFDDTTRDVNMDKKLDLELAGIFNKAIEGYKRLHEQQGFTKSARSAQMKSDYMGAIDPTRAWLEEITMELSDKESDFVMTESLYTSYKNFCERNGEEPIECNGFSMRLINLKPQLKSRKAQKRIAGRIVRGFHGLRAYLGGLDSANF